LIVIAILVIGAPAVVPATAFCSAATMQAPTRLSHQHSVNHQEPETSVIRIVFLGAIDLYRQTISPTSGARCGFSPSCSAFGRQAVKEYGPIQGVMMTADRLTRCNFFKEPDQNYFFLPNGLLFDPVSENALSEQ
jgi:putative membrane protein insertion efficiency factor